MQETQTSDIHLGENIELCENITNRNQSLQRCLKINFLNFEESLRSTKWSQQTKEEIPQA
jgi:hypothetical protein